MLSFKTTKEEMNMIARIADRAEVAGIIDTQRYDRMTCIMDLAACHANGCPLKLADLETADAFDFAHDVAGIARHMDRTTGQLTDCFLPRYAA